MGLTVYENLIWNILDDGSKIYILTLLIKQNFKGECKLISKIKGDTSVLFVSDTEGNEMELPINILDILNY